MTALHAALGILATVLGTRAAGPSEFWTTCQSLLIETTVRVSIVHALILGGPALLTYAILADAGLAA
jgi:hypothetical protein